jgi:hypothetical protein
MDEKQKQKNKLHLHNGKICTKLERFGMWQNLYVHEKALAYLSFPPWYKP